MSLIQKLTSMLGFTCAAKPTRVSVRLFMDNVCIDTLNFAANDANYYGGFERVAA